MNSRVVFKEYKRYMPAVQVCIDRLRSKAAVPDGRILQVRPWRPGMDPMVLGLVGVMSSVTFILEGHQRVVGMEDCIDAALKFPRRLGFDALDWGFSTFVKETYGTFPEYTFLRHRKLGQQIRVLHMAAEAQPSLKQPLRPHETEVSLVRDISKVTGSVWHPGVYTDNPILRHWPDSGLLDPKAWA